MNPQQRACDLTELNGDCENHKVPECELLKLKNDSFKGKVPKCHKSAKSVCKGIGDLKWK